MASISKHRNGYRASVCRNGIRKTKVLPTKAHAQQWADMIEREIADGLLGKLPDKTFGQLIERYRDEVSVNKRGYKREASFAAVLLRDPISTLKLSQIIAPSVAEWRDRRLKQVSPGTVRREWNLLSHACTIAIKEWNWLKENPFRTVVRPKPTTPRNRRISVDEIDRLMIAFGDDPRTVMGRVGHAFLFAIETGCRAGEICNLTWDCVFDRHIHLPRTKNGHPRDVPISTKANHILQELKKFLYLSPNNPNQQFAFGLNVSQIDSHFRKAKSRAMIEGLHFHDSRREALTRLSKKLSVLELARVSGHRDLRILQSVYYAPTVEELAEKIG